MKLVWQSVCLIIAFIFVFLWQITPLAEYTIQIFGVLTAAFILLSFRKKDFNPFDAVDHDEPFSVAILASIMLLLVFSTGGLSSSLFFLLYFLVFGIAFVFEPAVVFLFAFGVFLIFLPSALKDDVFSNMLRIGSVLFLSPLGFFFGKEYSERDKEDDLLNQVTTRSKTVADTIAQDVAALAQQEQTMKPESIEKLNDILTQTETLRNSSK